LYFYVDIISVSQVLYLNCAVSVSLLKACMINDNLFLQGGSLRGEFVDATPFRSSVKKDDEGSDSKSGSLVDDLGLILKEKGFNYHGLEVLYSGVYGTELTCEIFIGPVYYQRLRHMVSDKFQVNKFTALTSYKIISKRILLHIFCDNTSKYIRFSLREWL